MTAEKETVKGQGIKIVFQLFQKTQELSPIQKSQSQSAQAQTSQASSPVASQKRQVFYSNQSQNKKQVPLSKKGQSKEGHSKSTTLADAVIFFHQILNNNHRSPHPYLQNYEKEPDKRYGEQKLFWDGFQWVSKTTPIIKNLEHTTNTKKVQISGLPLELGLKAEDIKRELNTKLKERYRTDKDIIQKVDLILAQNAVAVELGTRDDIPKIKETFDGQKMLGQYLRVTSFEDKTINFNVSSNFNTATSMSNPIANSAQTAAQAAAIATAALRGMQGQDVKISLKGQTVEQCNFTSLNTCIASRILKVWNVVDPIDLYKKAEELQEVQMDMKEEFQSHGKIIDIRMIAAGKGQFGAEPGSIFVEYEDEKSAVAAMEQLRGRKYDNKLVYVAFVKPELYEEQFKALSESFLTLELPPETVQPQQIKEADYEFEQLLISCNEMQNMRMLFLFGNIIFSVFLIICLVQLKRSRIILYCSIYLSYRFIATSTVEIRICVLWVQLNYRSKITYSFFEFFQFYICQSSVVYCVHVYRIQFYSFSIVCYCLGMFPQLCKAIRPIIVRSR
eukprot:TRINITY_DN120419_c0_g1_i1.p2 TRINITY_DN120419_c0_g1~~TRINITY_DN120419_c0_g1_i1.p2  ORF type:complete len:561 (-),score=27.37 TRINITY_DN120419_c0_g1_i1:4163-5845(-)